MSRSHLRQLGLVTSLRQLGLVASLLAGCWATSACQTQVVLDTDTDPTELTETDLKALDATWWSVFNLAQAGGTMQNVSSSSGGSGLANFSAGVTGTCPTVTTAVDNSQGLTFTVNMDFGDTACPALGDDTYTCSGSASGTISQADQSLALSFESLNCNGNTLSGTGTVSFDITATELSFDGDWDLSGLWWGSTYTTDGNGAVIYDRDDKTSTIPTFDGTIGEDGETWSCEMADIFVSYQNNATLIPSAGTVTLTGSDIPTLTVTFDANSPATGEFQVSINGGPAITVNVSEL